MKVLLIGLGMIILTSLLFACGGGTWPAVDRDKFLNDCAAEGGSAGYCQCYLEGVMEKYPNSNDAKEIDFETSVELAGKCE